MEQRSDADLIRASRTDSRAFGELYDRHAFAIHSWLRRRVGEPAATDLTSETFASAWSARRRFRVEEAQSAAPWLYGIALNHVRHYERRGTVESSARARLGMQLSYPDRVDEDAADARMDAAHARPMLWEALERLSDEQRTAVELRVVDDLTFAEVAARMGTTEATARSRVSRALRAVRASLRSRGMA